MKKALRTSRRLGATVVLSEPQDTTRRIFTAEIDISEAIDQPLGDATRASIEIGMGAGTLQVGAQSEPDGLIVGTIATGPRDQIQRDFSISGETAIFKLHSVRQSTWGAPFRTGRGETLWGLQLNPEVPLTLDLTTGAV